MKTIISYLNEMKEQDLISDYAIGGATALIYYSEAVKTEDIDIFIVLTNQTGVLVNLSSIYSFLDSKGVSTDREYIIINNIPVQFLVPYNLLVEEALKESVEVEFDGTKVKLPKLEYLLAIMVQTGRGKDKARLEDLLPKKSLYDEKLFKDLINKFELQDKFLKIEQWLN